MQSPADFGRFGFDFVFRSSYTIARSSFWASASRHVARIVVLLQFSKVRPGGLTTDPADGFLELQFCPKPKYPWQQYRLGTLPAAHASSHEVQPGRHLCGKRGSSRCCCSVYLATERVFNLGDMCTDGRSG